MNTQNQSAEQNKMSKGRGYGFGMKTQGARETNEVLAELK